MNEVSTKVPPLEGSTEQVRREKLKRLRKEGVDPYPLRGWPDRDRIGTVLAAHDPKELGEGAHPEFSYRVAGRLVGQRSHGKTAFLDIRDLSGQIQAYARLDSLGEKEFERLEALDIGDAIGVEGDLHVTKRGELAIGVRECVLLAKALRDPPDLFHGITDPEVRYRQRELDLMANERSREIFVMRAKLIAAVRRYMNEHDFIELETPTLQPLTGGSAARPFTTHHNTLERDLFLRTATELYLKRAIVGGFENVYELGKFFRNEGMSSQHNPEFTMLEWFLSCADYHGVMSFAEGLISTVVEEVLGTTKVEREGVTIDFKPPWKRIPLQEAVLEHTGTDILTAKREELVDLLDGDVNPDADWAVLVDAIQGKLVEPHLVQPTYLIDLPLDIWPLVKPHPEHPMLGEAFDGIVAGMEIIGGGTDVNDPEMQNEHFVRQRERNEAGSERSPHPNDEEFVRALEYGMLTASGSGIGIDRLMMLITGVDSLRDVILFPTMREAPPK